MSTCHIINTSKFHVPQRPRKHVCGYLSSGPEAGVLDGESPAKLGFVGSRKGSLDSDEVMVGCLLYHGVKSVTSIVGISCDEHHNKHLLAQHWC